MSNFTPSKYQLGIFDFIQKKTGNAVVNAVAGSGKTSTIIESLKSIMTSLSVLFLAFNKSIVQELKLKVGNVPNVDIRTLHSLGMATMLKVYKFVVDENKYRQYVTESLKYQGIKPTIELEEDEVLSYKNNILKLVDLYRVNLCKNINDMELVAEKFQIECLDNECEIAERVVKWGLNEIGKVDFTDMIYFPVAKNLKVSQFDFVFIDECQDLSACQRELFLKALKPNGRFIAVGDPCQAIYGFAGADIDSFNTLKSLPNTIELPLSVCYRCGSSIIELAKKIVPQIEAKDNAHLGEVKENCKLTEISDGDLVLSRVNAPLVALCMHYIADGIKAYVKGRDIGANLINMIKKTKCRKIEDAIIKIEKEGAKVINKIVRKSHCTNDEAKATSTYVSFADKLRAIEVLAKGLETSDAVCNRIDSIFKDNDRNGICLSSVHKAKGLESNNVFIIYPEKFYNKNAMKIPWMAEQEKNLVYVAHTRAKHLLGFIDSNEMGFFENEK